jgi:hypothetical protein
LNTALKPPATNASSLAAALEFLRAVIGGRMSVYLGKEDMVDISGAACLDDGSAFAAFVAQHQPTFAEYIVILLALAPHVQPGLFQDVIAAHLPDGADFPAFGGVKGSHHRGVIPTGETAQFILAGDDLGQRLEVQQLLSGEHWFAIRHVLWLEPMHEGEPPMSGRLVLAPEVAELLTVGSVSKPRFSIDFPAEHLDTAMQWDELVLHPDTLRQVGEIDSWISHKDTLLTEWGMGRKMKPGYRALFYGPPGTGKTLTASLLGKRAGKDVFRIDLSRVVSKYIGETEKNLSRLFDKAENKGWILFFDEADALFGKRTDIRDAHDKYANQEVAYLLQRIETYDGLVILATNQRGNIDQAFVRRFQSIVHFPLPGPAQRAAIWRKTFPPQIALEPGVCWEEVARRHELSGAAILNVSYYCALEILAGGGRSLGLPRLEAAILREYIKEGKVV